MGNINWFGIITFNIIWFAIILTSSTLSHESIFTGSSLVLLIIEILVNLFWIPISYVKNKSNSSKEN